MKAFFAALFLFAVVSSGKTEDAPNQPSTPNMNDKITKTDAEWKQQLTPQQYHVLRE